MKVLVCETYVSVRSFDKKYFAQWIESAYSKQCGGGGDDGDDDDGCTGIAKKCINNHSFIELKFMWTKMECDVVVCARIRTNHSQQNVISMIWENSRRQGIHFYENCSIST